MDKNVGKMDKVVRITLAATLFSVYFVFEGNSRWLGLIGFIPLATGFASFCPLYKLLGVSTCKLK